MDYEVAVIGAGVMGSSAAHYLAKAGRKTILIDQFPLPHSRGSSGGHSRITRQANYGSPALNPLMFESNQEWRRIEEQTGMTLFRPSPLLCVGSKDCPVSTSQHRQMEKSISEAGFQHTNPSIGEVNNIYRTNFPSNYEALVDPSAGILLADKCIQAFQKLFIQNGGKIKDGWPVTSIEPGEINKIQGLNGEIIRAKSVVICPGAWFGPLLASLGIHVQMWVERISVFYWKIKDPMTPSFTFIDTSLDDDHFYSLPDFEYPGCIKLCLHVGPRTNPDERDKTPITDTLSKCKKYVARCFPCLESTPSIIETCMYTMTPDHSFVLDRHPKHKNIVFAGGFSGTGFKIAPSCGEALARMAMGLQPKIDFSSFNLKRFEQRSPMSRL